jgi:hypothetical protein
MEKKKIYDIFIKIYFCSKTCKIISKLYPHNTLKNIPSLPPNEDIYQEQIV